VIWGREDRTIPVAQVEVARKGIPNVEVHIFEKCGHAPMIEKAAAFNDLVLGFLK
jgi:pimeloyl-ACP methyl ester carboxylesterase